MMSTERREYKRVITQLTLSYDRIPPERIELVARQILSESHTTPADLEIEADKIWHGDDSLEKVDERFAQLSQFMEQINAKLDYLIAFQDGRVNPQLRRQTLDMLSLSGAGLSFLSPEPMTLDEYLRLHVQISRFPLREIMCLGQVVRQDQMSDGLYNVGIKFEAMHDNDREWIFRYISRMERGMLRQRRGAGV